MQHILITGGAGFVGSNLATLFASKYPDIRITCLDNLKRRGSELSLPRLKRHNITFQHGDIRNHEDIACVPPFDLLIECSAEPSVLAGVNENPSYLLNTNLVGTLNCLEIARKNKADFIFLSTSRVYPWGPLNDLDMTTQGQRFVLDETQRHVGISGAGVSENFPLGGPRSLYGATKLASELVIQEYVATYGLRGVINRCGVISGPWQMGKVDQGFMALWVSHHLWNGKLKYLGYGGKGHQVRDILFVRDLFSLLCMQIDDLDNMNGYIFNVGGGLQNSVSLAELTSLCQECTGNEIPIAGDRIDRPLDIPYYVTDNSLVTQKTGWVPTTSPKEIVASICEWMSENQERLKPILMA